ncbi:MAG: zinc-ribbon domain-containing protein [Candidatus Kariarchaeaceae archaeon]|jgi:uncharacterized protein YxjI
MYCEFCGTKNEDGSKFCMNCGNNIDSKTEVQQSGFVGSSAPVQYNPVNFKVEQKLIAIRPIYKVSDPSGNEFMIVRRPFFNFFRPILHVERPDGAPLGTIQANLWRTQWELRDAQGNLHATIFFPLIMFLRKNFQIHSANGVYNSGDSYFSYKFEAFSPSGHSAFLVDKKIISIRDSFSIQSSGELSPFITCLAAVCIDQRFHQDSN